MKLYETIFITRPSLSQSEIRNLTDKLSAVILAGGGLVNAVESCNAQELAYPINGEHKGCYVMMNITSTTVVMRELERTMRLNDDLLRFLITKVKKHFSGLSTLLCLDNSQGD